MKKLKFLLVFAMIFAIIFVNLLQISKTFAQKIEFEKKTKLIKVDGVVFGKIETIDDSFTSQEHIYSIKDVNDKECISLKMTSVSVGANLFDNTSEFTFLPSGQKAYTTAESRREVAKQLVKHGVLTKTGFNEEGAKKMCMIFKEHPYKKTENTGNNANIGGITQNNPYNFKMLERNRDANIMVFGDNVQQDFKDLGKITNTNEATNGKIMTTYKIFNHENLQIAEAISEMNGTAITITTFKDKSTQTIKSDFGVPSVKQSLSNYLAKNYYW